MNITKKAPGITYGKKTLQEDTCSTTYNDLTFVHNEKSNAYNESITAGMQ